MPGLIRFSQHYLGLQLKDSELDQVYKVGDSNRGIIVKARFTKMDARTRFYQSRTKLGPQSSIWMNDDLSKPQEKLAHQARQLYQGGKIFRTWTYLSNVFIQRLPTDLPKKITDMESFRIAAASHTGVIRQMFTLVLSHHRTYLPGSNEGPDFQTRNQNRLPMNLQMPMSSATPASMYQPLISLAEGQIGTETNQASILTPIPTLTPEIVIDSSNLI